MNGGSRKMKKENHAIFVIRPAGVGNNNVYTHKLYTILDKARKYYFKTNIHYKRYLVNFVEIN